MQKEDLVMRCHYWVRYFRLVEDSTKKWECIDEPDLNRLFGNSYIGIYFRYIYEDRRRLNFWELKQDASFMVNHKTQFGKLLEYVFEELTAVKKKKKNLEIRERKWKLNH